MLARWSLALLVFVSSQASGATIWLCRAYGGGSFWASTHCREHDALIERTVSVPDAMPFDQQVALGRAAQASAAQLAAPQKPVASSARRGETDRRAQCEALKQRVASLDAQARLPQSGATQDWLTREKNLAQDRRFRLRC